MNGAYCSSARVLCRVEAVHTTLLRVEVFGRSAAFRVVVWSKSICPVDRK